VGLLEQLDASGLDLMILKNGATIFSSAGRGIAPLLEAIEALGLGQLAGSVVVDRVVGKAAALVMGYFKAACVYTKVLSRRGASYLDACGISCCVEEIVEEIVNKDGTDMCPFEKTVLSIENPAEGYRILKETLRSLRETS